MAHKTHRNQIKKKQNINKKIVDLLVQGKWIENLKCKFQPMSRDMAEKALLLDLSSWHFWNLDLITPEQVKLAHRLGFDHWIETIVDGRDSAHRFFTIEGGFKALRDCGYAPIVIHTRCANDHGHPYGPVYLSASEAKADGHTHRINCSCGKREGSVF